MSGVQYINFLGHGRCRAYKLTELGEMLATRLAELERDPTPNGCDLMVLQLHEASTCVRKLCAELLKEQSPTV